MTCHSALPSASSHFSFYLSGSRLETNFNFRNFTLSSGVSRGGLEAGVTQEVAEGVSGARWAGAVSLASFCITHSCVGDLLTQPQA